jgi:CRP/FNR family transcriptional regulator, cyclic AMP receptor protein
MTGAAMTRERTGRPSEPDRERSESPAVPDDLFQRYGATVVTVRAGGLLFDQGDMPTHFYAVKSGRIRMVSMSEKGREFTQGWFDAGQSFGEPPFFAEVAYPAAAMAEVDSAVWKCTRPNFQRLLLNHPEVHLRITRALSRRLVYKATMLGEIAIEEAEHRLVTLFRYLRTMRSRAGSEYRVPFTRRQLADMTGLRVETVIRTVKAMESRNVLKIVGGRIIWISGDSENR